MSAQNGFAFSAGGRAFVDSGNSVAPAGAEQHVAAQAIIAMINGTMSEKKCRCMAAAYCTETAAEYCCK